MPLLLLKSVPSTMDVARENVLEGRVRFETSGRAVPPGVLAEEQMAGRGQRGRHWFALSGECLCATYYFGWDLAALETAGQLAFLAGVAVVETLEEEKEKRRRGEEEKIREEPLSTLNSQLSTQASSFLPSPSSFGLKWPNDILLNGRKVGGILIELMQTPEGEWIALIGVGINVRIREFPIELAEYATSLWRESIEIRDIVALAEAIGDALERFAQLRREHGFEAILSRWRVYDATPGRVFETVREGETVQGVADGIEPDGALRLRLSDGSLLRVLSASSLREKKTQE